VSVTAAPPPETPAKDEPATDKPATPKPDKASSHESPEDKIKTRDYWQGKFKAARQDVAKAKEQQQLSEDELNLLQIQQVRELDPMAKSDLTAKVQSKQSDVNVNTAATQAAQKNLDDLEQEFKDSGAPEEWNQTD
jgi:ribosome-binding protein aMBF1 (putative translation factor)